MINKEQALKILLKNVRFQLKHRDYDRVCEYAVLMKKIVTGENCDDLIKRFNLREDDVMFNQRKNITQLILKPCANAALRPLYKINGVTPMINTIEYEGKTEDKEAAKEIKSVLNTFYGGESIDVFLGKRFPQLNGYDPNAFFLGLFENFNHRYEKPVPYITEVSAAEAVDFEYFNNTLQYLIRRIDITIPISSDGNTANEKIISWQNGYEYQIYVDNDAITFTQLNSAEYVGLKVNEILSGQPIINLTGLGDYGDKKVGDIVRFTDGRTFLVRYYQPKAGRTPAIRVGSIGDPSTDGRTCISLLDNAIPYFMKSVKMVSEMDLSMSLHVFPQKIVATPRCPGAPDDICRKGENREGGKCTACGGTGKFNPISKTAQDVIEVDLPDGRSETLIDLSKLVYYVTLPIDLLEFLSKAIKENKQDILQATYNSDVFQRSQITNTATEKNIEMDSVYDTLQPFANNYAAIRMYFTHVFASYLDRDKDLVVQYRFPRDFKFKTLLVMLGDLKTANDSDAPGHVKEEINNDISNTLYQDRPEKKKELEVKNIFSPFDGMSESAIQYAVSQRKVERRSEILHFNFKLIFTRLEQDAIKANLNFYEYPYETQLKKINEIVDAIIEQLDSAEVSQQSFLEPSGGGTGNGGAANDGNNKGGAGNAPGEGDNQE